MNPDPSPPRSLLRSDHVRACSFSLKIGSANRRQRALEAIDHDLVGLAIVSSLASAGTIITLQQMVLEDLGDYRLEVTILPAAGGATAEEITAAAVDTSFLDRLRDILGVSVEFSAPPAVVVLKAETDDNSGGNHSVVWAVVGVACVLAALSLLTTFFAWKRNAFGTWRLRRVSRPVEGTTLGGKTDFSSRIDVPLPIDVADLESATIADIVRRLSGVGLETPVGSPVRRAKRAPRPDGDGSVTLSPRALPWSSPLRQRQSRLSPRVAEQAIRITDSPESGAHCG